MAAPIATPALTPMGRKANALFLHFSSWTLGSIYILIIFLKPTFNMLILKSGLFALIRGGRVNFSPAFSTCLAGSALLGFNATSLLQHNILSLYSPCSISRTFGLRALRQGSSPASSLAVHRERSFTWHSSWTHRPSGLYAGYGSAQVKFTETNTAFFRIERWRETSWMKIVIMATVRSFGRSF
jgi:hypothetical protein